MLVKKIGECEGKTDPFNQKIDIFLNKILTFASIEESTKYGSLQEFYDTYSFSPNDVVKLKKRLPKLWEEYPKKKYIYTKIFEIIRNNCFIQTGLKSKITKKMKKSRIKNKNIIPVRTPIDFTDSYINRYIRRPKYQSKAINRSNNLNEAFEAFERSNSNNDSHMEQESNYQEENDLPPFQNLEEKEEKQRQQKQSNQNQPVTQENQQFDDDEEFFYCGKFKEKKGDDLWDSLLKE